MVQAADTPAQPAARDRRVVVPPGYHLKIVKGAVRYCTKTTTLGSRFPTWLCVDEDGLRTLAERRESNQQDLRRAQSICAGAFCQAF
jgi:hypothetical protein